MKNILSADIGGTNSRFAHFTINTGGKLSLMESVWLKTTEAGSFPELIDNLNKSGFGLKPDGADIAVMAVAGPVEDKVKSNPPLIEWDIDLSDAKKEFGFKRCVLINDFIAQAFACRSPIAETAEKILPGFPAPDAATAVIGAGTGLGKAVIMDNRKGGYIAFPSEGGHTNFPFVSEREFEYQRFLLQERKEQYITGNTVVSGKGLSYLHQFLTGRKLEPSEVAGEFSQYPETLEWASRFYARVCRNYVLETLAMGGLYIAGGVAAKSPELLTHPAFEQEFRSSDTLSALLSKIPVSLMRDENSGLWGGAMLARQILGEAG
ncbi:MAG: glucokinase [Nitrospiraceae bacterium]|nr:MAG: glucokinase [Nitrospiraceae bacterium]